MVEETICLQCGNKGFENAFVYCIRCLAFAVHRYCLDVVPETFDEIVRWLCDDCQVEVRKQSDVPKHDAIPDKTRHHDVSKTCLLLVEADEHACKDGSEQANDACTKFDLAECGESASQHTPVQLDGKNDEDAIHFPEDGSKTSQQSSSVLCHEKEKVDGNLELIELPAGCPKQKKRRARKQKSSNLESTPEKNQHNLDTETYIEPVKVDINKCTVSASEPIELSADCLEQKEVKFENKGKRKRNIMEPTTEKNQHRLTATSDNEYVKVDAKKCTRSVSKLIDELSAGCLEQRNMATENKRKLRKRNIMRTTAEEDQHRLAATSHNARAKVDINECTRSVSETTELSAGCLEQTKTVTENKRKRRKRQKNIVGSTTEKDEHRVAATSNNEHVKVDIECTTRSESELIELSAGCLEEKKTEIENKRKRRKRKTNSTTSHHERVKANINGCTRLESDLTLTSKIKEVESSEQKGQTGISTPFGSVTDLGSTGVPADHSVVTSSETSKKLKRKTSITSSKTIRQKQVHRTSVAQALENTDSHLDNEFADLSNRERDLGLSNNSIENRGPDDEVEQTSTTSQSRNACYHSPKDLSFSVAEPVALPIWRGSFNILNKECINLEDLIAHISNKACHKVYKAACQFQQVLRLEMLPKSDIWPKSFVAAEPSGDSIALYFFPSKIREQAFEKLVNEMIHKELAFKACVQNVDLLIFTSTELPLRYWRFHNKYYLWGVFREKQAAPLNSLSTGGVTEIPLMGKRCDDGALVVH